MLFINNRLELSIYQKNQNILITDFISFTIELRFLILIKLYKRYLLLLSYKLLGLYLENIDNNLTKINMGKIINWDI